VWNTTLVSPARENVWVIWLGYEKLKEKLERK
jgi:hypothetical protein